MTGNVRELQNIVECSLILNPRGPVSFEHLDHKQSCKRPAETQTEEGPYRFDDVVTAHINKMLVKTDGKVHGPNGAASLLGINASTLRNKMNKLGIRYGRKQKWSSVKSPYGFIGRNVIFLITNTTFGFYINPAIIYSTISTV